MFFNNFFLTALSKVVKNNRRSYANPMGLNYKPPVIYLDRIMVLEAVYCSDCKSSRALDCKKECQENSFMANPSVPYKPRPYFNEVQDSFKAVINDKN